ncbi:hypothetical protein HPP92_025607 [Vanilla planifolia]|uniref:Uncharacterized protein n=1 Tax=Vanilla planifolia TaxID=51239 RepID=A0A835PKG0_VANPL|nr:hypothetical protein HPP92_025607 [Vanilla planifolia]
MIDNRESAERLRAKKQAFCSLLSLFLYRIRCGLRLVYLSGLQWRTLEALTAELEIEMALLAEEKGQVQAAAGGGAKRGSFSDRLLDKNGCFRGGFSKSVW